MALDDNVLKLRKEALAKRRQPVPDAYQGVSKDRIEAVLREIDRYTADRRDTVFALLDDEHARETGVRSEFPPTSTPKVESETFQTALASGRRIHRSLVNGLQAAFRLHWRSAAYYSTGQQSRAVFFRRH